MDKTNVSLLDMVLTEDETLAPPLLKPSDNTNIQHNLADVQKSNKELNYIIHQRKAEQQTNNQKILNTLLACSDFTWQ